MFKVLIKTYDFNYGNPINCHYYLSSMIYNFYNFNC